LHPQAGESAQREASRHQHKALLEAVAFTHGLGDEGLPLAGRDGGDNRRLCSPRRRGPVGIPLVVHEAQPFANTELPAPPGDSFEKSPGVVNGRRSEQVSRDDRLAPAAITVIAAAAEQKHNDNDDQQEFHNFLQNINSRTVY
jgi:hypothetical protein